MKITRDNLQVSRAVNGYLVEHTVNIDNERETDTIDRYQFTSVQTVFTKGNEGDLIEHIKKWAENK